MAGGIFISYRRDDSRQAAGRLADALADHFGPQRIFRDVETIELGVDFAQALNQALASCGVMLVLIGREWLQIQDAQGRRRLEQPQDWIRLEIATALKRDIRVVPVLVDGAQLPDEAALPPDLQPLVRRQALELADGRWKGDLQRLLTMLAKLPGLQVQTPEPEPRPPAPPPAPPKRKWGIWWWVGAAVLLLGVLANEFDLAEQAYQPPANVAPVMPPPAPTAPVVQPAAATAPAPAPSARQADISGFWRSADGSETYQFQQQGQQVQIAAFMNGVSVGGGGGSLQGSMLLVTLNIQLQGFHLSNANCQLQASTDFRAFNGMCNSPAGQYPVQLLR